MLKRIETHKCIACFPICIRLEAFIERINIIYYITEQSAAAVYALFLGEQVGPKTHTKQLRYQLVMIPYQIGNYMLCVCACVCCPHQSQNQFEVHS